MSSIASFAQNVSGYLPSPINSLIGSVSKSYGRELKKIAASEKFIASMKLEVYEARCRVAMKNSRFSKKQAASAKKPCDVIIEKQARQSFNENSSKISTITFLGYGMLAVSFLASSSPIGAVATSIKTILDATSNTLSVVNITNYACETPKKEKVAQEITKFALPIIISASASLLGSL